MTAIEVNPAFYNDSLNKTDTQKNYVVVYTNKTASSITLHIYTYNYSLNKNTGKPAEFDTNSTNVAASLLPYIKVEPNVVVIPPSNKQSITVTIQNGGELSPGGHYAAVVAQVDEQATSKNSPIVAPSLSTLFLINKVGGEKYGLGFNGIQDNLSPIVFNYPSTFHLSFTNSGNTHLVVYGTIEEKDMFGRLLYKGIVNTSSLIIFPKFSRSLSVDMVKVSRTLPVSFNTLKIGGIDSLGKVSYNYQTSFVYVNFIALTICGVIVVFLITTIVQLLKKRSKK